MWWRKRASSIDMADVTRRVVVEGCSGYPSRSSCPTFGRSEVPNFAEHDLAEDGDMFAKVLAGVPGLVPRSTGELLSHLNTR